MSYLNLNSDPTYSSIGVWPIAQQVLGVGTVLKNIIGLIKDICIRIFSCEQEEDKRSVEDHPAYIEAVAKLKDIENWDKIVEKFKKDESREEFGKLREKLPELINRINERLELSPLSGERQRYYNDLPDRGFDSQYSKQVGMLKEQLENRKKEIEDFYRPPSLFQVMSFSERMQNIALGIITAIPVVGSGYHGVLLRYYFTDEKTVETV